MKLTFIFKATLATFVIVAIASSIGLVNTWRWYSALPDFMAAAPLPQSFYLGTCKLALQFLASATALIFMVFASGRIARVFALAAVAVLLLMHLASWMNAQHVTAGAGMLLHATRFAFALWLLFLLVRLAPNNSFKPNPLRGSA